MRQVSAGGEREAGRDIEQRIADAGGGEPLPDPVRERLERKFGVNLGMVRVHTDEAANELAIAVAADACTVGPHIYFSRGRFDPDSESGWSLLAHEIGHVAQWQEGLVQASSDGKGGQRAISRPGDSLERDADQRTRGSGEAGEAGGDVLGAGPGDVDARSSGARVTSTPAPSAPVLRAKSSDEDGESGLARAIRTRDIGDIKDVDDFSGASDAVRLDFIGILHDQAWVGPRDESALERIWNSFGDRVLEMAESHSDLWAASLDRGAELDDISSVATIKARFRSDVCALARGILERNEAHVLAEMQVLGVIEDGEDGEVDPESSFIPEEQQDDRATELQNLAEQLVAAREAVEALREVPVGFDLVPMEYSVQVAPVFFDPARPPAWGPDAEGIPGYLERWRAGMRSWDEVKGHHDQLQAVMALMASESPVLYAALSQRDDTQLAAMAGSSAAEARQVMAGSLQTLLGNIRATLPKVGGDLDDRDLTVLHQQLFQGGASASGTDWSREGYRWAARDLLADHESAEFWLSLGLGTLAAAAFVVAELATLGTATFFIAAGVGLGAAGTMVGRRWEQWGDLSTAADAGTSSEGQVVSQEQSQAALVTAVVESAFAFLDLIPVVKGVRSLVKGGGKVVREGVEQGVKEGGEKAVKEGIEEAGEEGMEQGVKEGVEEMAEEGLGTAAKLKPEDAANWADLEKSYIGKNLDEVGAPEGYVEFERGGKSFLRRTNADDRLFARLTVEDGIITAGRAQSKRLSKPHEVVKSVDTMLEKAGVKVRPEHHQAHHVIPDQIVLEDPLLKKALERGIFKHDGPENLALLARKEVKEGDRVIIPEKVDGLSKGLPRHQGPHPEYSLQVRDVIAEVRTMLLKRGADLDNLGDKELEEAVAEILEQSWRILEDWETGYLY